MASVDARAICALERAAEARGYCVREPTKVRCEARSLALNVLSSQGRSLLSLGDPRRGIVDPFAARKPGGGVTFARNTLGDRERAARRPAQRWAPVTAGQAQSELAQGAGLCSAGRG